MNKVRDFYKVYKKKCYLAAGLLLSCLFMVPFLLLGTGSIVTYHDQLDGELFSYLLTAKYLFTDIRVYPEIMNGLPAAGAVPPAPLFVLLYVFFEPFTAFMLSQWIICIVGFCGMYLLLLKLTKQEFISFSVAVIFMLLPFYPVYGLCIPGQPMLLFSVLSLLAEERLSGYTVLYSMLILFYGAASSPVLVGFACLLFLGSFALYETVTALRKKNRIPLSPWFSLGLLLITYIVTNLGLIRQVLFPETTYISHKTEMVLSAQNFADYFKEAFTMGISYAQSYHTVLFLLILLCLVLYSLQFIKNRISRIHPSSSADSISADGLLQSAVCSGKNYPFSPEHSGLLAKSLGILAFILVICLFYAFYHESFITGIRNASTGILKTFNLDRVCWLLPTAWCILAGYLLCFITDSWKQPDNFVSIESDFVSAESGSIFSESSSISSESDSISLASSSSFQYIQHSEESSTPSRLRIQGIFVKYGLICIFLGIWGMTVLLHSSLRPNLSKLLKGGNYYALDWNNFFAEDIFSQIDSSIGKPQDSYHVISVGIYPAAAAYNGFYCLDGYSNNYPLEYKHTFRRIMEGELDKSDYVRDFFDNWGNRCYITTAEQANYYTFEKKWNSVIYDLDLNTDQLKDMDCKYIFSAAYLMNAEEKGLSLLQEAPFETENSWYHIYVYAVN